MRRGLFIVVAIACSAIAAPSASAALQGPVYPVPGGLATGHGGNTCHALSDNDGAGGKNNGGEGLGQTWVYGGDTDTTPAAGCPADLANPTPTNFDTTRFDNLYWGASVPPALALDGDIDDVPDPETDAEVMTLVPNDDAGPNLSNFAGGVVAWTGVTNMNWCNPGACAFQNSPVNTRLILTIRDQAGNPVALTDASTISGITNPGEVGAVVEIDGTTVQRFSANWLFEAERPATAPGPPGFQPALDMFNSLNHPNPPTSASGFNTQMSFGGGFWYEGKDPTSSFTFPAPQNGVPVTFTSTSSDPDGTIASQAWDLDNDGLFDDGTDPTATQTYGPGTHTVRLQVTDDDGETAVSQQTFTINQPQPPPDTTAPTATLTLTKAKLLRILAKGLKGKLNVNEAARTVLKVTLPRALAKRLKLRGAIGSVTVVHPAAGNRSFTIKIKPKAKRKLKKQKSVKFIVAGPVVDTAGNRRPVKKSLTARK